MARASNADRRAPQRDPATMGVRALQTRTLVELTAKLPIEQRRMFERRVGTDALDRVRNAFSFSWFPMDEHMRLCGVLYEIVGRAAFIELFRETFCAAITTPLLSGIFGVIRRMSDDTVTMLLRNSPRIYSHVTRDVGSLHWIPQQAHEAVLELRDWPSSLFDQGMWLDGTQGCIVGAMEGVGAGAKISVEVETRDEARGYATYRLRW